MTVGDSSWIFSLCSPKKEVWASRVRLMMSSSLFFGIWPFGLPLSLGTHVLSQLHFFLALWSFTSQTDSVSIYEMPRMLFILQGCCKWYINTFLSLSQNCFPPRTIWLWEWHYYVLSFSSQKPGYSTYTFFSFHHYILSVVKGCWLCLLNISGVHLLTSPSLWQYFSLGHSHLFPGWQVTAFQWIFWLQPCSQPILSTECSQNSLYKLEIISSSSPVSSPFMDPQDALEKVHNH